MHIEFNKVTWYSKLGALILFIIVIPLLTFYFGMKYQEIVVLNNSIQSINISKSDFLNLSYNIDGEEIKLVNGKSPSMRIFGEPVVVDINGDNREDAVFYLIQETSGTGVFYFIASAISAGTVYQATNSIFIGDRISPQNINIDKEFIRVNYVTRREDEPFSAEPSIGVTKYLKISNGELVEVFP